jgi:hypothetical protein
MTAELRCQGSRKINVLKTAILLILTAAAPAEQKPVQSYDTYKSWLVACDNTLACVAKGFSGDVAGAEIRIERDAGPAGTLAVSISANEKFGWNDVRLDGAPLALPRSAWRLDSADGETSLVATDLAASQALVRRLANGAKVTLGAAGEIPLDGFAAAMLRLDERQGRIGGVTALLKLGPAPASQVPAALPRRGSPATRSRRR